MPVYEITHLTTIYSPNTPTANDNLTFTVEANEIFVLLGVNGMLDFFASMPVYRIALILASATSFLLLALPTMTGLLALSARRMNRRM